MNDKKIFIPKTHYDMFKVIMSDAERADAIIRAALRADVVEELVFPQEELDGLPKQMDDLVDDFKDYGEHAYCGRYRIKSAPEHKLYFYVAHKSKPEPGTSLEMIDFHRVIRKRYGKWHKNRLVGMPPSIPLLFYNGGETWDQVAPPSELIKGEGPVFDIARAFAPRMQVPLMHTKDLTQNMLAGNQEAWAGAAAMTYCGRKEVSEAGLKAILRRLPPETVMETAAIRYLLRHCQQDAEMIKDVTPTIIGHRGSQLIAMAGSRQLGAGKKVGLAISEASGAAKALAKPRRLKFGQRLLTTLPCLRQLPPTTVG